MSNPFYTASGTPVASSFGASAAIRGEFATIMAAFDKLPQLSGNANKIVTVNGGESGLGVSPVSINAILQMLDPTYVSSTVGIPVGAKRLNPATGFEQWNGTTWATVPLGYLTAAGGSLTGALIFANNVALDWKDTGAVVRKVLLVNSANQVLLGDVDNALPGTVNLRAQGQLNLQVNLSTIAALGSGGMSITGSLSATGSNLTLGANAVNVVGSDGSSVAYLRGAQHKFQNSAGSTTWATIDASGQMNIGALPVTGAYMLALDGPLVFDSRATINGVVGAGNTTSVFTYDTTLTLAHYGLAWKDPSWAASPVAMLSGFGGIALFTSGAERARLLSGGNLLLGTTTDGGQKLQVGGAVAITGLFSTTAAEGLRITDDGAFISFYEATAPGNRQGFVQGNASANALIVAAENGNEMRFNVGGTTRMTISAAGDILEGSTTGKELGYKGIPVATGWVNGQCFSTTANQTVSARAAGETYCVFNNSSSSITLTQGGGVTLRLNGTTATGNRTLLPFGFATIWYVTSSVAVISGAVS
jgi:hypothetical protein